MLVLASVAVADLTAVTKASEEFWESVFLWSAIRFAGDVGGLLRQSSFKR